MKRFDDLLANLELWVMTESSCLTQGALEQTAFARSQVENARTELYKYVKALHDVSAQKFVDWLITKRKALIETTIQCDGEEGRSLESPQVALNLYLATTKQLQDQADRSCPMDNHECVTRECSVCVKDGRQEPTVDEIAKILSKPANLTPEAQTVYDEFYRKLDETVPSKVPDVVFRQNSTKAKS